MNLAMILYTVQPGDTLSDLARKYNTTVEQLAKQNGIRDPDEIYPGQCLRIQPGGNSGPAPIFRWYIVRPGDTILGISRRFRLEPDQLIAMNNLADPDLIYPGQLIRIR